MKKISLSFLILSIVCSFSIFSKRTVREKRLWRKLYAAAKRGHLDKIKRLVAQGADVHYQNSHDEIVLHEAADEGHLETVKYLIEEAGSKIDVQNGKGRTPLFQAVDEGHEDITEYLLSKKADPNIKTYEGSSILHEAVFEGKPNAVKMLVEHGADVNFRDAKGNPARYYAKGEIAAYLDGCANR